MLSGFISELSPFLLFSRVANWGAIHATFGMRIGTVLRDNFREYQLLKMQLRHACSMPKFFALACGLAVFACPYALYIPFDAESVQMLPLRAYCAPECSQQARCQQ